MIVCYRPNQDVLVIQGGSMLYKLSLLFNHPNYFRYAFFVILIFTAALNHLVTNDNIFIFYILTVVFLGIGYYNRSIHFLLFLSFIVVATRFFLIPGVNSDILTFFVFLVVYSLITLISAGLMNYVQKTKKDAIEFTKTLANTLDSRDKNTMNHSENVAKYAYAIARKMNLPQEMSNNIYIGGLLHDIGKIAVPEQILNKPGKLTDEEYDVIKSHTIQGYHILKPLTNFKNKGILDITLYHHERYDGKGYPAGLKGEEIPLVARIVGIADAFDAMTSNRVYRSQLDLKYTLGEIRKNKGKQFDPNIADAFLSLFEDEQETSLNKLKENIPHNTSWDIH